MGPRRQTLISHVLRTHYTMHTNPWGGTDTSDVGVGGWWRDADGGTKRREPTVSKTTTSQTAQYYRCAVCGVHGNEKFQSLQPARSILSLNEGNGATRECLAIRRFPGMQVERLRLRTDIPTAQVKVPPQQRMMSSGGFRLPHVASYTPARASWGGQSWTPQSAVLL